mmetsp:Transcript_46147/g.88057  ORF Transcript_46147/g.88057 Transcript_46147/m.88057 type:complete len:248 (-) Transcript_46147:276-1019(-)
MTTAGAFQLVALSMLCLGMCSIFQGDSVVRAAYWLGTEIRSRDHPRYAWPGEYGNATVGEIRVGMSSVLFIHSSTDKIMLHRSWSSLKKDPVFDCESRCQSCASGGEATQANLFVGLAMQLANIFLTTRRTARATDGHYLKLLCTGCSIITVVSLASAITNFRLQCGANPPDNSSGFGPIPAARDAPPAELDWSFGPGYVGTVLSTLFSFATLLIHVMTPSAALYDIDEYTEDSVMEMTMESVAPEL